MKRIVDAFKNAILTIFSVVTTALLNKFRERVIAAVDAALDPIIADPGQAWDQHAGDIEQAIRDAVPGEFFDQTMISVVREAFCTAVPPTLEELKALVAEIVMK